MTVTYLLVSGMTCGACVSSITDMITKMNGVDDVNVSLITEEAKVVHDEAVSASMIIQSVEDCGFQAKLIKQEFPPLRSTLLPEKVSKFTITGMTCGACSASITEAIESLDGVSSVSVSLITEEAMVHYATLSANQIIEKIEDCGFEAKLVSTNTAPATTVFSTKVSISGMTCAACTSSITNSLESNAEISKASVSLVTEEANIEHTENITSKEIVEIVQSCGFEAKILSSATESPCASASTSTSKIADSEDALLQIFGVTDHLDLVGLQYNIEARINSFVGIKNYKIAFNVPSNGENLYMLTEANSPAVQNLRPESDNDEENNVIDELFIEYNPSIVGIRDVVDELNSINDEILFVMINSIDQASTSQLKLLSRVKDIEFWRSNFFKSLLCGIPVIVMSHTQDFSFWKKLMLFPGLYLVSLLQFVLTFHVQFHLGAPFLKKFYIFIKNGGKNATMDVLVCISTLISFTFSVFSVILSVWNGQLNKPPKLLFETSCMLVAFISMGKWLENQAKGATSSALSKLLSLTPTTCTIIEDLDSYKQLLKSDEIKITDFQTRSIGIDLIQKGDVAVILPGSKVPADGKIIMGETEIDESVITGESLPIFKKIGDEVIGGTVNGVGLIHIEVVHTGKNSQLQQIINLVKDSQVNKAPVQGFADYVASRFVPTVLFLSCITFLVWALLCFILHSDTLPMAFNMEENGKFFVCLKLSISVIVVACPCALGLAAPTAMMVGTGVGASNGVLIKGGDVLENASKIDIILFDKTGTLTTGGMNVTNYEIKPSKKGKPSINESDWWSLIGSVENNSEHPIGIALTKMARTKLGRNSSFEDDTYKFTSTNDSVFATSISNFKVIPGMGITSRVTMRDGRSFEVSIGNERLIKSEFTTNTILQQDLSDAMREFTDTDSLAFVVIDDELSGYISLADKIKPHARDVINYLQYEQNIIVGIITGDNKMAAIKVGKELGIPECNIFSEVSPINKDRVISDLKQRFGGPDGSNVGIAFVGDGINDAPALAQADVGMAISCGSDIAIESANIVLIGSKNPKQCDLHAVPIALSISKVTFNKIKTNFIWAAIYNLIMLPFAMGCFLKFNLMLPPMAAAASMALSSVSVVISSLFLKKWKPPVIGFGITSVSVSEEEVGLPFSLTSSTIEDFNRQKKKHKFWHAFKRRVSQESHTYEMLSNN